MRMKTVNRYAERTRSRLAYTYHQLFSWTADNDKIN